MKIIERKYIFISLRREVFVHQNGLTSLSFIDVIVSSQKSVRSCIYLLVIANSEYSECVIFFYKGLYHITGFTMVLNLCILIDKLQRLHNIAARLIPRTNKMDHITPALIRLHWLPVEYRSQYKHIL
jgi:hypothetical protein